MSLHKNMKARSNRLKPPTQEMLEGTLIKGSDRLHQQAARSSLLPSQLIRGTRKTIVGRSSTLLLMGCTQEAYTT
jgi:hypothetical protein